MASHAPLYSSPWPDDRGEPDPFASRHFYELCQQYRHAKSNDDTVAAFEQLKAFGRNVAHRSMTAGHRQVEQSVAAILGQGLDRPEWMR